MSAKKKTWFKSAFVETMSPAATGVQKTTKLEDVFLNEDDSINFSEIDLSTVCNNNNQTKSNAQKSTPNVKIVCTDFKSSNWIENFAPCTRSDLAIHVKKLNELEDWFNSIKEKTIKNSAPILLLTGPSGSGKSAGIKILAKEFGYSITEWITPLDIEHTRYDRGDSEKITYKESQNDKFAQFLFQSSRYRSVFDTSSKRLVLVEDFPHVFIKDPASFEAVLERYSNYGKSPLIFIVTDTKSRTLNIGYSLFTDEIRNRFNITSISFNPVADTMLKKGLKRICDIMGQPGFKPYYIEPSNDTIDSIVFSAFGDIRNAVINLHFASQRNSVKLAVDLISDVSTSRPKKKPKNWKKSKLKSLGTDENVTVLHALGRVFNPKYREERNDLGHKVFTHSPNDISSLLATQPSTSLTLLHHNYIGHFQNLEEIINGIDLLSCSEVILNEWRSDLSAEIGMNLAVRGIMTCNENPVMGRWMPIKSAKNQLKPYQDYEKNRKVYENSTLVSSNNFACDYRTYVNLIPKNEKKDTPKTDEFIE